MRSSIRQVSENGIGGSSLRCTLTCRQSSRSNLSGIYPVCTLSLWSRPPPPPPPPPLPFPSIPPLPPPWGGGGAGRVWGGVTPHTSPGPRLPLLPPLSATPPAP